MYSLSVDTMVRNYIDYTYNEFIANVKSVKIASTAINLEAVNFLVALLTQVFGSLRESSLTLEKVISKRVAFSRLRVF